MQMSKIDKKQRAKLNLQPGKGMALVKLFLIPCFNTQINTCTQSIFVDVTYFTYTVFGRCNKHFLENLKSKKMDKAF